MLQALFEGTSDIVFAKGVDGRYFAFNEAGARLAGRSVADLIGKTDAEIFPPEFAAQKLAADRTVLESGKYLNHELTLRTENGLRTFSSTKAPIRDAQGKIIGVFGIARETTETNRAERSLKAQRHVLEILAMGAPLKEVLDEIVRSIESETPGIYCTILLVDREGKHLLTGAAPSLPDDYNRAIEGAPIGARGGSCGTAAYLGKEVIVTDTFTDPLWTDYVELAKKYDLRSCWSTPVISKEGTVLGTFAMYSHEMRSPTALDFQLIKDATHLTSIALEHIWMRESLVVAAKREKAMGAVSKNLLEAQLDLPVILERGAHWVVDNMSDGCMIHLLSRDQKHSKAVAFHHVNPEAVEMAKKLKLGHFFIKQGSTDLVVRTGKSVLIPEVTRQIAWSLIEPELRPYLEKFFVHSFVSVALRAAGRTIGVITAIRDQTKRPFNEIDQNFLQEFADRFAQSVQSAFLLAETRDAVRIREDFMAVASHELKTPLTPLKMQLNLLRRILDSGGLENKPKTREVLRLIGSSDQQIKKLVWLIDDMLEASRISAGRLTLKEGSVDLAEVVQDVCDRFAYELGASKCELRLNLEPGVVGRWDPLRIEQIVTNLLTNAMKYGSGNPIEITVTSSSGNGGKLVVRDFGIGISPVDQGRIFQRFERAVTLKRYGGLGLGLFITRQIVEAHHGTIKVESQVGRGSTFTVELPKETEAKKAA